MSDLIGRELGPYHIVEQIGAGGMATVYKAYHAATDRYVAVKVLPEQMRADPGIRKRFEQETKVIAGLEHTHILPVHDSGEAGGRLYLVMRYVKAGTLKDRIAAGPMSLAEVDRIFRQVGSALDYAHRLGVVHRDVKPGNVLLDDEGSCYLTDFGLAKILEAAVHLTATGVGVGTPAYMSPEQGQGEKTDARSDIYSLGVMLYEMITGQAPYQAETPMAVVLMHITAPLPPLRSIRPDIPEEVEQVILKAMAKDPDDRFQTVREMMDAFEAALEVVRRKAPPEPLPEVEPLPAARSRAPAAAAPRAAKIGWQWAAVGATAVGIACLAVLAVTWSLLPFKIQVREGKVEVVRRTLAAPTVVWSPTPQGTESTALSSATATGTPPAARPTSTPPTVATATPPPDLASTSTSVPQPTPTPVPPSPTAMPAANLSVTLAAFDGQSANVLAWSPDGRLLAVAASGVDIYDVQSWESVYTLNDVQWAQGLAFSPDGMMLATAAHDGVRLWDTTGWGELRSLPGSEDSESVAFSPDGTLLATGTGSTVKLWDVADGSELRTIPGGGPVGPVAFAPDGRTVAAGTGMAGTEVKLWDVQSGDEVHVLKGHSNWIRSVAFAPDGMTLASGSVDNTVRLWNVSDGRQLRVLSGHSDQVESVAFSPDGRLLASASWDLTIRLWDVTSGVELRTLTGHTGWVTSAAFSPDGAMVASSSRMVRLWGLVP